MMLTAHLGCKSVRECKQNVDSREFTRWIAYYSINPFGEYRGDVQAGIIAATIANANPYRGKNAKPLQPSDFFPKWDKKQEAKKEKRDPVKVEFDICMVMGVPEDKWPESVKEYAATRNANRSTDSE